MKLYKFRQVDTYSLSGLSNSTLWFSDLSDFNDPFEGQYILEEKLKYTTMKKLKKDITSDSIAKIPEDERLKAFEEIGVTDGGANVDALIRKRMKHGFEKSLLGTIRKSKAVCLSKSTPQHEPLLQRLMWSHYSNGLRGFCMVLDSDAMQQYFLKEKYGVRQIEIKYQDTPLTISLDEYVNSMKSFGDSENDFIQRTTNTIGTKSTEWAYENEYRFLSLGEGNAQKYPPEALLEIVIGEKMPKDQQKLVVDTARSANPNVVIKLAQLKKDSYQLEIVDYTTA